MGKKIIRLKFEVYYILIMKNDTTYLTFIIIEVQFVNKKIYIKKVKEIIDNIRDINFLLSKQKESKMLKGKGH